MREPQPITIDVPTNLDDAVAAELLTVLRALSAAVEQHYAGVIARHQQREWDARQTSLWSDDEPPF